MIGSYYVIRGTYYCLLSPPFDATPLISEVPRRYPSNSVRCTVLVMSETHPTPGAGAVIIDSGRMLLIRRGRGAYVDHWAVPGGRQRRGETMREAAAREVLEETGLIVEVGDPVWVGDILDEADPPAYHYTVVDFLAVVVGGKLAAGDDAAEARWVPVDEVRAMDLTPTMVDLIDELGL